MEEVDETLWEKLVTGALVGAVPTISMILMSFFVFNMEVSKTFEGTAQFFCAGMIHIEPSYKLKVFTHPTFSFRSNPWSSGERAFPTT